MEEASLLSNVFAVKCASFFVPLYLSHTSSFLSFPIAWEVSCSELRSGNTDLY